jgi:hypothetical protein
MMQTHMDWRWARRSAAVACMMVSASWALAKPVEPLGEETLAAMKQVVEQRGIEGFLAAARAEQWETPVIDSAWRLRYVAPREEVSVGEAARSFGRAVLGAVEDARVRRATIGTAEMLPFVRVVLDMADWIGRSEGYGNALIQTRARNVATQALGQMVADLTRPLEPVQAELPRLLGGGDAPEARARILNREAGATLFPLPITSDADLRRSWAAGTVKVITGRRRKRVTEAKARGYRASEEDEPMELPADVREHLVKMGIDPDPDHLDPHDGFFEDDVCPPPGTTLSCWDTKKHEGLIVDTRPLVERLEALIRFRQVVGAFPTTPKKPRPPRADGEIAFKDAWAERMGPGVDILVPVAAWSTYAAVMAGQFSDVEAGSWRGLQRTEAHGQAADVGQPRRATPSPPLTPQVESAAPTETRQVSPTTGTPSVVPVRPAPTRTPDKGAGKR